MPAISLAEIQSLALLDRLDVKFIMHEAQFAQILDRVRHQYRVLEINNVRPGRYYTTYFDTPDFAMYQSHHNGMRVRHKVRWRWYIDNKIGSLEVKEKTNRDRTVKMLTPIPAPVNHLGELAGDWMPASLKMEAAALRPVVSNRFRRITLAVSRFLLSRLLTLAVRFLFSHDVLSSIPPIVGVLVPRPRFPAWRPWSSPHARTPDARPQ